VDPRPRPHRLRPMVQQLPLPLLLRRCRGDAMRRLSIVCTVSAGMLTAGCAGPLDPPLGLGPGLDQLAGMAMLAVLITLAWRPIKNMLRPRTNNTTPSHRKNEAGWAPNKVQTRMRESGR
jgi:hypothetical protein